MQINANFFLFKEKKPAIISLIKRMMKHLSLQNEEYTYFYFDIQRNIRLNFYSTFLPTQGECQAKYIVKPCTRNVNLKQ